jgi:hypothetical protein
MLLAGRIVARIATDRGVTRVDQLTQKNGIDSPSLQRLFTDYIGVGPSGGAESPPAGCGRPRDEER